VTYMLNEVEQLADVGTQHQETQKELAVYLTLKAEKQTLI